MSVLILDQSTSPPTYYTLASLYTTGSPMGAWSSDKEAALQFARPDDAKQFVSTFLRHALGQVQVVTDG